MEKPNRKHNRLVDFNYSNNGVYFITICTHNRKRILSNITVGTGVLDCPKIKLTNYGLVVDKYINQLNDFYEDVFVEKYVIMPDHIHLLLCVKNGQFNYDFSTKN